mmetsp:Transcript_30817/g.64537  ORF Transcript_30817/g.64537 Transcript_30817/m.64537 type:complete len:261 (+) Transcript_30817:564-1346(+)
MDYLKSEAEAATESGDVFMPGPVGESPVHICFLLGLDEIGKEVIAKYYPNSETLSVAYKNDLLPLLPENPCSKPAGDNGDSREIGLYTGETLLHIAIAKEDAELVAFLLDKGIEISSTANGVFFQPRWIRPCVKDLTRWQRFLSWMAGVDLDVEKFAVVARQLNEYSACYYGEYPLSFAASVGSVQICKLLLACQKARGDDPSISRSVSRIERSPTFVQHNKHWDFCGPRSPMCFFFERDRLFWKYGSPYGSSSPQKGGN